jgi:hypothetical protein
MEAKSGLKINNKKLKAELVDEIKQQKRGFISITI